jgi:hypothetical protein
MSEKSTVTTHDTATCTNRELFAMRVNRKPEDDDAQGLAVEVEMRLHLHSQAEGEHVANAIEDVHERVMQSLLVGTLRAMLSPTELVEVRDTIARILTGDGTEDDLDALAERFAERAAAAATGGE